MGIKVITVEKETETNEKTIQQYNIPEPDETEDNQTPEEEESTGSTLNQISLNKKICKRITKTTNPIKQTKNIRDRKIGYERTR